MWQLQRKQSPKSTDDFLVLTISNVYSLDSSEVDFISAHAMWSSSFTAGLLGWFLIGPHRFLKSNATIWTRPAVSTILQEVYLRCLPGKKTPLTAGCHCPKSVPLHYEIFELINKYKCAFMTMCLFCKPQRKVLQWTFSTLRASHICKNKHALLWFCYLLKDMHFPLLEKRVMLRSSVPHKRLLVSCSMRTSGHSRVCSCAHCLLYIRPARRHLPNVQQS